MRHGWCYVYIKLPQLGKQPHSIEQGAVLLLTSEPAPPTYFQSLNTYKVAAHSWEIPKVPGFKYYAGYGRKKLVEWS
jgi:hypothetical protein